MWKGVSALGAEYFVRPELGEQSFLSSVGDVVRPPNRHVYRAGTRSVDIEIDNFGGEHLAQRDARRSLDDGEALDFGQVVVIATANAGMSRRKRRLTLPASGSDRFYEGAALVRVWNQSDR